MRRGCNKVDVTKFKKIAVAGGIYDHPVLLFDVLNG